MRAGYVSSTPGKTWLFLFGLLGCTPEKTIQTVYVAGSGQDTTPTDEGAATVEDTSDPGPAIIEDTGPALPDLVDIGVEDIGPLIAEDANLPPKDIKIDGVCNPTIDPMNLPIGMPCTAHEECETCYCYDEEYLSWGQNPVTGGSFRFCSLICEQGSGTSCDDWATSTSDDLSCARFTQKQIDDYDLSAEAICVPTCEEVANCAIFGPQYDECGNYWEGKDISGRTHCQIIQQ